MIFRKKDISIPAQPVDENKKISAPKLWPYRLLGNIVILVAIGFGCLGIMIIKSNFVLQKLSSLSDHFYQLTSEMGFTVDDILIYGRDKTSLEEITNIANTRHGDNILRVDIHQMKADLEQLPWVKSATVSRSYFPNILRINMTERQVQSLWQINDKFYPIDMDGSVIHTEFTPSHPMLIIIGKNAPKHINELLDIIEEDEELFNRIKIANYISNRRWNIIIDDFENGITIKLPQENMDKAWKKLIRLNKTKGILKRKLTIIDLRFENKILVKPRRMSVEERLKLKKGLEKRT